MIYFKLRVNNNDVTRLSLNSIGQRLFQRFHHSRGEFRGIDVGINFPDDDVVIEMLFQGLNERLIRFRFIQGPAFDAQ